MVFHSNLSTRLDKVNAHIGPTRWYTAEAIRSHISFSFGREGISQHAVAQRQPPPSPCKGQAEQPTLSTFARLAPYVLLAKCCSKAHPGARLRLAVLGVVERAVWARFSP